MIQIKIEPTHHSCIDCLVPNHYHSRQHTILPGKSYNSHLDLDRNTSSDHGYNLDHNLYRCAVKIKQISYKMELALTNTVGDYISRIYLLRINTQTTGILQWCIQVCLCRGRKNKIRRASNCSSPFIASA